MIDPRKLSWFIENRFNVLFVGEKGVGKTSIIVEALEKAGLKYRYFSAATMDPWTDFVGLPKEKTTKEGVDYLSLVKPLEFATDSVEAIIFDEFNRAPAKVKNACMELLQFGSINGVKFNNLKIIWAAINPDNGDYQVEPMDPAQEDRFQVKLDLPYALNKDYLIQKYPETACQAIEWWDSLNDDEKRLCSPRRIDYCLKAFQAGGDLTDFLSNKLNVSYLISKLASKSIKKQMEELITSNDVNGIKRFINGPNFQAGLHVLEANSSLISSFAPYMTGDVRQTAIAKFPNIQAFLQNMDSGRKFVRFFGHYRLGHLDWHFVNVHFKDETMTEVHRVDGPAIVSEDGSSYAYVENGLYHRENDLPAIEMAGYPEPGKPRSWSRSWFINGKEHRDNGPSTENSAGDRWFGKHGSLHGHQAVIRADGAEEYWHNNKWYQTTYKNANGYIHREDGPAILDQNGEHWFKNGLRHREDGPAIIHKSGMKQYYIQNTCYSKEEWEKMMGKVID